MPGSSFAGLSDPRPISEFVALPPVALPAALPPKPMPTPEAKPLNADDAVEEIPERLPRDWWRVAVVSALPVPGSVGDDGESVRCESIIYNVDLSAAAEAAGKRD